MNTEEIPLISVPLGQEAHCLAQQFAAEQASPHKGKRVYLNTLAVYAVHNYLKWLQIETDLEQSDSWHPSLRAFFEVADLVVPELGKLECLPVPPHESAVALPSEVIVDRIGYVAVQFPEHFDSELLFSEVQLCGFIPAVKLAELSDQIQMSQLQPIETLLDHLSGIEFLKSDDPVAIQVRERLTSQSIPEIVARFESIYRSLNKDEGRYSGGDVLAGLVRQRADIREKGSSSIAAQESFDDDELIECQDLAEELLEKLGEIWQD